MNILQHKNRFAFAALLGILFTVLFSVTHQVNLSCIAAACAMTFGLWHRVPESRPNYKLGFAAILNNQCRFVDQIAGIQGVAAGATVSVNFTTDRRYHSLTFNTTDAGSAASVSTIITNVRLLVGGVTIRDLTAAQIVKIAQMNGYFPQLGELPIFFSEPWFPGGWVNEPDDVTSWDMAGQSTFQVVLTLAGGTTPGITGTYEYDYKRNALPDKTPQLQIVTQKNFGFTTAAAQNVYTTLPTNFPIRRLMFDVGAGTITGLQIKSNGSIIFNTTSFAQLQQYFRKFRMYQSQTDFTPLVNATGPAALGISAALQSVSYFSSIWAADMDSRLWRYLKVANNDLTLYVTTSNATTLNILQESVPDRYAS